MRQFFCFNHRPLRSNIKLIHFKTLAEISTSISEALHVSSSNSSLTSVSSPKSDRDFDDADINVNDRM